MQIVAECYASTTENLAKALGFFSRRCSLESLEMLESENHLVTALSVGVLAWSVADGPKKHQGMENQPCGRDGVSRERGLQSTNECEVSGGNSHGEVVLKEVIICYMWRCWKRLARGC